MKVTHRAIFVSQVKLQDLITEVSIPSTEKLYIWILKKLLRAPIFFFRAAAFYFSGRFRLIITKRFLLVLLRELIGSTLHAAN